MNKDFDLKRASIIFFTLFIAIIMLCFFHSMIGMSDNFHERKTVEIEKIIDKALVHCYALEGSYPDDIHDLSKYGVIIDEEHYVYYYEVYGSNLQPEVTVLAKE